MAQPTLAVRGKPHHGLREHGQPGRPGTWGVPPRPYLGEQAEAADAADDAVHLGEAGAAAGGLGGTGRFGQRCSLTRAFTQLGLTGHQAGVWGGGFMVKGGLGGERPGWTAVPFMGQAAGRPERAPKSKEDGLDGAGGLASGHCHQLESAKRGGRDEEPTREEGPVKGTQRILGAENSL